ncbi:Ribonuclease H-like protein [Corchorus capsularis]|uniref:Ribonuclease H-like protein n=1 Tax=Corchorus capsularis TaxID=210143 RepID=A0A1R3G5D0_COCAP|nr:Ribonuclease H-like protein [Corchorus capsularis]
MEGGWRLYSIKIFCDYDESEESVVEGEGSDNRCEFVFKDAELNPLNLTLIIQDAINDYCRFHDEYNKVNIPVMETDGSQKWAPPPLGWLKVNTESAFNKEDRKAAFGLVIKIDMGLFSSIFESDSTKLYKATILLRLIIVEFLLYVRNFSVLSADLQSMKFQLVLREAVLAFDNKRMCPSGWDFHPPFPLFHLKLDGLSALLELLCKIVNKVGLLAPLLFPFSHVFSLLNIFKNQFLTCFP